MSAKVNSIKAKTHSFYKKREKTIYLNKVQYTGYKLYDLPKRFGYIFTKKSETEGLSMWFNRQGLTFIQTDLLKTGW